MEQFEKVKSLGRGAQGTVILVKRKADQSKFVIKKIYMEDQSPEDQEEVMNEIKVLAKLAHPNVVAYYGSFMEDGDLNVVMEYADGGTLFQHIQRAKQPLSEEEILSIFAQLVLAINHLHQKKILHRDLKTKNIFMTKKLQLKLGDFGLSKMLGSQTSFAQSAVGTPYYLSPELCEGKPYNHKSDVWAIGCVLYELTTFRHAFDATNLPALVMSIVQAQYTPVPTSYSDELRQTVQMCLMKNPEDRPDVQELMAVPIVKQYINQSEVEVSEEQEKVKAKSKPFFETGTVSTALKSAKESAVSRNSSGVSTTSGGPSTDDIMAEVQEEAQFERLIQKMRGSLRIEDRIFHRVPYFKCFKGTDMVTWMLDNLGIRNRTEAINAAQTWMDAGVFYHVTRSELFTDSESLFRFK
ncbi:hypothetical protein CYMTET_29855, partial [Cymbomonas tetramitiformis]